MSSRLFTECDADAEIEIIHPIIKDIKNDLPDALTNIRIAMTDDKSKQKIISRWKDEQGLNIIHYSICYNRPDVLLLCLSKTEIFSTDHEPVVSPYAHLAAVVGAPVCLDVILTLRPQDFFKTSSQKHMIVLPADIMATVPKAQSILNGNNYIRPERDFSKVTSKSLQQQISRVRQMAAQRGKPRLVTVRTKMRILIDLKEKTLKPLHEYRLPKTTVDRPNPYRFPKATEEAAWKYSISSAGDTVYNDEHMISGSQYKSVMQAIADVALCKGMFYSDSNEGSKVKLPKISTRKYTSNVYSRPNSKQRSSTLQPKQSTTQSQTEHTRKISNTSATNSGVSQRNFEETHNDLDEQCNEFYNLHNNKTPLTLAAERGHYECVKSILSMRTLANNAYLNDKGYLVLAVKEGCEHATNLVIDNKVTNQDILEAIDLVTSELLPGGFSSLIDEARMRGINTNIHYYNKLIKNSLTVGFPYFNNLTTMIETLIEKQENINKYKVPASFSLYTLIHSAYLTTNQAQIEEYMKILKLFLEKGANPLFNEERTWKADVNTNSKYGGSPTNHCRELYTSYFHCTFTCATNTLKLDDGNIQAKDTLRQTMIEIQHYAELGTKVFNGKDNPLFNYLMLSPVLGIDRAVLIAFLNIGLDPDFAENDRFAINIYFDTLLPSLKPGGVQETFDLHKTDIENLMLLCKKMSFNCLKAAVKCFIDKHLFNRMLHLIPLIHYFCYLVDKEMKKKRRLILLRSLPKSLAISRKMKKVQHDH